MSADILKAAGHSKSSLLASLLLEHVLTPIYRSDDRDEFGDRLSDYIASLAPSTATGTVERAELSSVANAAGGQRRHPVPISLAAILAKPRFAPVLPQGARSTLFCNAVLRQSRQPDFLNDGLETKVSWMHLVRPVFFIFQWRSR